MDMRVDIMSAAKVIEIINDDGEFNYIYAREPPAPQNRR
jgi:hypothetical protein